MDLLTAILACSVYGADDALVHAIADSNSHGNEFSVLDAAASMESDASAPAPPKTLEAALARLEDVRSNGGQPLLGWMHLPPGWVTMFGRDLREAFDPCVNVSIGTAMLSEFDYECSVESSPLKQRPRRRRPEAPRSPRNKVALRSCVVRKYAAALGMIDLRVIVGLELRYQRPMTESDAETGPIQPIAALRPWGADRLFFPSEIGTIARPSADSRGESSQR